MQIENCRLNVGAGLGRFDCSARTIVSWSVFLLWALLVCAAGVLWWRRLAGALVNPLESAALVGTAVAVAAVAAAVRAALPGQAAAAWLPSELARLLRHHPVPLAARQGHQGGGCGTGAVRWRPWTVSAAVAAIGVALSLRGTSLVGLALFWGILAGEEFWGWTRRRPRRTPPAVAKTATLPADPPPPTPASPRLPGLVSASADEPDLAVPAAPDVLQQIVRRRGADGGESLSGWIRVPLAASQRTANVHVAFCPPFPRTPQVAVDQLDGPAARIKKVQVLPYGARLDLKLVEWSDVPAAVVLQFSALSGPPPQPVPEAERPADDNRDVERLS